MLPLSRPIQDREELFISRYVQLRDWALRLTERNTAEAEDLLHDAFIHFTLSQTPVENIQNLDGYLYTMLRNLRLSQARRLARTPLGHLSLIDYDSAEAGLNSTDPRDRIKAQDELRAICQYACIRKETSKAGSVLILRFFHGYFPNEIAKILRSPRSAVDNLLQTARREARLFKADPDALTFLHTDRSFSAPQFSFGQLSTDILSEVRDTIFQPPLRDCPKSGIRDMYHTPENVSHENVSRKSKENITVEKPVDAPLLSHIAGCRTCLDQVNELLGLPPLVARLTADGSKPTDKKPKSDGGSGGSGGGMGLSSTDAFLKRSRKRLKQVFEHQPEELLISVNGFIIGSQRINSEMNELALSVNLDEKIGFIEVFSERNVCLLFQSVEPPPDGSAVQPARVELSGGRMLELSLDFSETWPQLYASYRDPSFSEARSAAGEFTAETLSRGDAYQSDSGFDNRQPRSGAMNVAVGETHGNDAQNIPHPVGVRRMAGRIADWVRGVHLFRPEKLATAFGVLLFVALSIWKFNAPGEPITVADLMQKAIVAEQQAATATDVVLHKTYTLEERNEQGTLLAKRKVETYQSGEQKLTVRRLYDEQGRILAGEWKRGDGSRTLYSNKAKPQIGPAAQIINAPTSLDEAWLIDTSAAEFQKLAAQNAVTVGAETADAYSLRYGPNDLSVPPADRGPREGSPSGVVVAGGALSKAKVTSAQIKFSKDDLRVIEQIIAIQQGDQRREYRFTEASYQKLSPRAVQPSVFEPERELLAVLLKDLKIKSDEDVTETAGAKKSEPGAVATGAVPSTTATADLEVEALNLLSQAGADRGEQVEVKRTNNILRIDGIVESESRKNELRNALASIANHPAVRVNIMTVAEALAKEQSRKTKPNQGQTTVQRVTTDQTDAPVKDQLQRYFGSEQAANNFAARMIGRSRSAMSRAGALKRLVGQFTLAELKELSPDARAKWLNLIRSHARGFQQETAALRQDLTPVFGGGSGGASAPAIDNDAELIRAVGRLFELGAANDRTVRTALSISTDNARAAITSDLFRSLRTTEALAAAIERAR